MIQFRFTFGLLLVAPLITADPFNPLQWLRANGQWYPGPDISAASQEVPGGCVVDQVAIASRHGSRYPDPGAYSEWLALEAKTAIWDNIYLPPILKRLQKYVTGVNLTTSDISIMPYLCGFETQITGKLSPFCDIFTESEFKQYEYRQDLRYYYGTGPGTDLPSTLMLPYLNATATLFLNGPGHTYSTGFTPPPIVVSFTHDNQLNELATAIGVFNTTGPLPPNK
ncbi:unnamed protein product [Rhizoctonia solani]|uniref:Phosphoglycerate mutase-like protein n=1 Tax=Rhizoctonia solani TaxID=456999 RepID=A0A8H3BWU3_9AGAM|nr:unnamed protein product [Rhizoctonia solani]